MTNLLLLLLLLLVLLHLRAKTHVARGFIGWRANGGVFDWRTSHEMDAICHT
jgi:hypothetical protein